METFHRDSTILTSESTPDARLDARGLRCPLPLLRAKIALNELSAGQILKVEATDEGSVKDFHSFCDLSRHTLVAFDAQDGLYRYMIQKG